MSLEWLYLVCFFFLLNCMLRTERDLVCCFWPDVPVCDLHGVLGSVNIPLKVKILCKVIALLSDADLKGFVLHNQGQLNNILCQSIAMNKLWSDNSPLNTTSLSCFHPNVIPNLYDCKKQRKIFWRMLVTIQHCPSLTSLVQTQNHRDISLKILSCVPQREKRHTGLKWHACE